MRNAGMLAASVMACGCSSSGIAERSSPPTLEDLPKAPGALLAAEREIERPPVKAGETRIQLFDIDVALPAGASVHEGGGGAYVSWPRCSVAVIPSMTEQTPELQARPRVDRRVGTLELACVAGPWTDNAVHPVVAPDPACLAICDHMTPVPGSTAEEPYPTDRPVIELESRGGLSYRSEGMLVWSDGTVQYSGSGCGTWRGRRATLAPERIAELLAAIERGGFFQYHRNELMKCSDAIHGTVTVRGARLRNSLAFNDCGPSGASTFVQHLEQAIGQNPCKRF